ncbi:hypothetical protein BDV36DRAFT_278564 [Aspergillus pseudocaelatus]|uniref:Uncharacterized protein n=1 Tax=Aspergillus pseudocaelatus TaxID=1825620 RepID=A0ABQ6VZ88_9EURO|nr:hypothetical protein BDV36DRAFT_278564 [Aspergillus pseudocaelatus]
MQLLSLDTKGSSRKVNNPILHKSVRQVGYCTRMISDRDLTERSQVSLYRCVPAHHWRTGSQQQHWAAESDAGAEKQGGGGGAAAGFVVFFPFSFLFIFFIQFFFLAPLPSSAAVFVLSDI